MLRFLIPLVLTITSATSLQRPAFRNYESAATETQIKFAVENKYDGTGPGAKQPESAYITYKTLDDALIAYLDDPDTKLPEEERARAINKLLETQAPKFKPVNPVNIQPYGGRNTVYKGVPASEFENVGNYLGENSFKSFNLQKIQGVKSAPISLGHYTRESPIRGWSNNKGVTADEEFGHFAYPKYSFSYGVEDKSTGDTKSIQESRDGGSVRGYYSFLDADGKTRTVHYVADDKLGFRADVKRT